MISLFKDHFCFTRGYTWDEEGRSYYAYNMILRFGKYQLEWVMAKRGVETVED